MDPMYQNHLGNVFKIPPPDVLKFYELPIDFNVLTFGDPLWDTLPQRPKGFSLRVLNLNTLQFCTVSFSPL